MQQERIVDRVRKLLELSKSSNINEASNAAAAAQRLMSEHRIEEAMLEIKQTVVEAMEEAMLFSSGTSQKTTWHGSLAVHVCETNGCAPFWSEVDGQRVLRIIGTPSDAATCRYLFSYLAREIDRLAEEEARPLGKPGRTWFNSFRLGAVRTIGERLREAEAQEKARQRELAAASDRVQGGSSLVLVNQSLVRLERRLDRAKDALRTRGVRKAPKSKVTLDHGAYAQGQRAGARVSLSSGPALGEGERKRLA